MTTICWSVFQKNPSSSSEHGNILVIPIGLSVSQRNVGVLLPRIDLFLASQHLQIAADLLTGGRRFDDVVNET